MEFRILGPLEAFEGGVPVALGGTKQRALLAVFLLYANEVVSTERLIDALWEEPPAKGSKAVQVYVARLRKALGGTMPRSRPPGYVLELSREQLDLDRFRRLRQEARDDPTNAAEKLGEALALWRGPALGEFMDEPFARVERVRLEEERLEALEERIEAELASGRHAAVVGELEALVAMHPLRERLRGQLMVALYRGGRQAEALSAYRAGRRELVEELGIEPGRALRELEEAILRQDAALELSSSSTLLTSPSPAPVQAGASHELTPTPTEVREERKAISVLLVDVAGFIPGAGAADPEDVRAAQRPLRVVAKREVERFGGSIASFMGNALIGVFGAPAAHEDDPERAVRAALAIRQWSIEQGVDPQVRMAVNTGVALVPVASSPHQWESIAAGHVVNTAQRLRVAAPVNGVVVGEQTYRATWEAIAYRERAMTEADATSSSVWEAREARSQRGVDLVREPRTPLVGRERELDLLASALARAVEERSPQLITLVGVPGIGKSRLVFELANKLARDCDQITWRQGRCLPYGDGVSLWAFGEIVKAQAGILESDSPDQAAEKLRGTVAEVLAGEDEAPWVERELRLLVGAGTEPGSGAPAGEGFAAWRRFLERLAELRPLVLVFEDLHWADDGLLDFLDGLVGRLHDAPLLVLCTARPELLERRPGWGGGKSNALTISLSPLSDADTTRLVAAVLKRPLLEAGVHQALIARASGNPLYAEQFARVVAEGGSVGELPETVHGIISARLDGLSQPEKALLQDASVVGKVFWPGAIEALGAVSRQQAEELFFGLERKEFVQRARRSSVAGEVEFAFRHVLLRDLAYEQIPRAARGEKHQRAAGWTESLARPDDHAEMLAHHYLSALEYAQAAGRVETTLITRTRHALRRAGDRALSLAAYPAAWRFYSAAIELWPDGDRDRVWLLVHAGRAKHGADRTGIDLLEQAFEELRARGEAEGAAEVAIEISRGLWLGGERDQAYVFIDHALGLTEGRGDSRARVYALVERAAYHATASENLEALRAMREALPLTQALGLEELRVRALEVLGSSRVFAGDLGGLEDTDQAITLAREHNAFSRLIVAELNLYGDHFFRGDLEAASETLRAARLDVERYGTADQRQWLQVVEAHEDVLHGRWSKAIAAVDAMIADREAGGAPYYLDPACRALRASIELARGTLDAATHDSAVALEGAQITHDPQLLAPALVTRAMVALANGQPEEASKLATEALALSPRLVDALQDLAPAVTTVEFAWLLRDLNRASELLPALTAAPPTPWVEAARAITAGDLPRAIELVAHLAAPAVDAYTRLRTAQATALLEPLGAAAAGLEDVLAFYRSVGATRYVDQAEALLADRGAQRVRTSQAL